MLKHDVARLEAQVKEMSHSLKQLADGKEFEEFVLLIHRPGWTTPAEFMLVSGVVDSMLAQTKSLASLKQALLVGSRQVGAVQKS